MVDLDNCQTCWLRMSNIESMRHNTGLVYLSNEEILDEDNEY